VSILITARSVSLVHTTTFACNLVNRRSNWHLDLGGLLNYVVVVRMYPRLSTITPEPRLRSAWGCASGRPFEKVEEKVSLGSSGSRGRTGASLTCGQSPASWRYFTTQALPA